MKTNEHARKVLKVRRTAGLLALLLLLSAEFWVFWCFGHSCGHTTAQPQAPVPAIGDWFATG